MADDRAVHIYKQGFPAGTPTGEAETAVRERVAELYPDLAVTGVEVVCTPDHEAAGEFLIKAVLTS